MEPNTTTPTTTTPTETPVVSTAGTSGAAVKMLYVEREMNAYAITASEMRQVGSFNRISTLFFSLGSASFGSAIGIWWDIATGSPNAAAQTVGDALMKLSISAGVVCFLIAGYFAYVRRSEIAQILSESTSKQG